MRIYLSTMRIVDALPELDYLVYAYNSLNYAYSC